MRPFASLRRRADFSRLRQRGRRIGTKHLTVYRADAFPADPASLVGIAIGVSIGKAVVRNTLRRRLKAILHEQLAGRRLRLLFVARPGAAAADFAGLRADVTRALG
ncbi:MAG: ribonuclease P protein component [Vulcanimicrobiaceae bacterium]